MLHVCAWRVASQLSRYSACAELLTDSDPCFSSEAPMQTLSKKQCLDKVTGEEAAKSLAARSKIIMTITPIIANRLAVVHQRDKLRYVQTRSGAYLPMVRKFGVGDYVYLRRPNQVSTLQIRAHIYTSYDS